MSEWISVEERLPKKETECFCHYDGSTFSAVHEKEGMFYKPSIRSKNKVAFYLKVEDWMPIPEPPKSED